MTYIIVMFIGFLLFLVSDFNKSAILAFFAGIICTATFFMMVDNESPSALDVYRGITEIEIVNNDTVVNFKK